MGDDTQDVLLVKPVDSPAVRDALRRNDAADLAARMKPRADTEKKPPPPGQSHLEEFSRTHTLAQCAREIQRLARKEDVPRAWEKLANGWRVEALREPIKAAILEIGWERLRRLVLQGDYRQYYEQSLCDWLEELEEQDIERKQTYEPVRVLRDADYGVVDW
jgi:hypothetical protein